MLSRQFWKIEIQFPVSGLQESGSTLVRRELMYKEVLRQRNLKEESVGGGLSI